MENHLPTQFLTMFLEEDKGVTEMVTPGGKQKMVVINESGLYALILGSKLPSARRFKHWVTSEVLPAIRKHGIYATEDVTDKILNNPEFGIELLTKYKEERDKRRFLYETLKKEGYLPLMEAA